MPRILKENINTSFFHIMTQGINKERIFNFQEDREKYIKLIKDTKEKIDVIILAYCIMNNHAHILCYEEDTQNLMKFMHIVNLRFAKYYNKKYDRVGYVFRDRYKAQLIHGERQLRTCIRYIHNNPVKAHICDSPEQYKYSSYTKNIFNTNTQLEKNARKYISGEDVDDEFILLEDEENREKTKNELIKEIIVKNGIEIDDLKNNNELLKNIIKELHINNGISFRKIAEVTGISREKLRYIIK